MSCNVNNIIKNNNYVTQSEKTDHVLRSTKNEIMILFISMSFLLAHIKNLKQIGTVISEL